MNKERSWSDPGTWTDDECRAYLLGAAQGLVIGLTIAIITRAFS